MMIALIAVLVFASVSLATMALLRPREDAVRRRIHQDREAGAVTLASPMRTEARGLVRPFARRIGNALASMLPHNLILAVDRKLAQADDPWSLPGFLFTWAVAVALGIGVMSYVAASSDGTSPLRLMTMSIAIVGFAAILPYALLRRRAHSRQKAIVRALPDSIDLLLTSVEAGLGVDSAFALVTEKTKGPLSDAFALYLRQVGLGGNRRVALIDVAQRTGVPDFVGVANAVNMGEELGTTLGDVLRVQAEDLRRLRRQRAEAAAQRAPVLMTIPLALCFLPAIGAVVIVPSVLNLLNFVDTLGG